MATYTPLTNENILELPNSALVLSGLVENKLLFVNGGGEIQSNSTTGMLAEGTNLYYTDARVSAALISSKPIIGSSVSNGVRTISDNTTAITTNAGNISNNSTAISTNSTAISNNSTAISTNSTAISNNSTAISTNSTAISNNSTAISTNSTAISNNSTAISTNSTAISTNSTAISTNSTAISTNSTAITTNAGNISNNSTAISNNSTAIAGNTTAIGNLETKDIAETVSGPLYYTAARVLAELINNNPVSTANLTVTGNLTVNGNTTTINSTTITTTDNIILLNRNNTNTNGAVLQYNGVEIDRGALNNYQFVFDEITDLFRIGEITGILEAVATRSDNMSASAVCYWEGNKLINHSGLTYSGSILTAGIDFRITLAANGISGNVSILIKTNIDAISANTSNINTNTTAITTNAGNITTLQSHSANSWLFNQNLQTTDIVEFKDCSLSDISIYNPSGSISLITNISKIYSLISTNTGGISTNTGGISTNTGNITTNTGNITTNTSNITTNTGNISTNTSNIATNGNAISININQPVKTTSSVSFNKIQCGDLWISPTTSQGFMIGDIATGNYLRTLIYSGGLLHNIQWIAAGNVIPIADISTTYKKEHLPTTFTAAAQFDTGANITGTLSADIANITSIATAGITATSITASTQNITDITVNNKAIINTLDVGRLTGQWYTVEGIQRYGMGNTVYQEMGRFIAGANIINIHARHMPGYTFTLKTMHIDLLNYSADPYLPINFELWYIGGNTVYIDFNPSGRIFIELDISGYNIIIPPNGHFHLLSRLDPSHPNTAFGSSIYVSVHGILT